MNQRMPIPAQLNPHGFRIAEARERGLTETRTRADDLQRPFHGVRTLQAPATLLERARAYAPLLRGDQVFTEAIAAEALGLPLPASLRAGSEVAVAVGLGGSYPRRAGVRPIRIARERIGTTSVQGLEVTDPLTTWATLARVCTVDQLVAIGDALLADFEHYPGRVLPGPLATLVGLHATVERWERCRGVNRLREALGLVRPRVESPMESHTRLALVRGGLPEPEIQVDVFDQRTGAFIGRSDMAYRDARVLIEFEGAHHRGERQWKIDIKKYAAAERAGFVVVRVLAGDLFPSPHALVRRVAALLS